MRGQSLTERDATDRYKWSKASVCAKQSWVSCSSGCGSLASSWTCSASEKFMLSALTISEAKSARGTQGLFNFCSFSKRSCSCCSPYRFRLSFDLSARASWSSVCSLCVADLPWPKFRVGTQSIWCRSYKGAAVPEWKCWSQTLLLDFLCESSQLIAEIHLRLRSMLRPSTSGPWFVTTAGTRYNRIPSSLLVFLELPTIRHIGILRKWTVKKGDWTLVFVTSTCPPYWYLEHQHGGWKSQVILQVMRVQAKNYQTIIHLSWCAVWRNPLILFA